jgi:hypothetical protein
MKKILLFLFSLFFINQLSSQCSYNIYPQYINITAAQTITAQNNYYWVCENVVLTVDSSLSGTFFLEQNSKIIFSKASMGCDAVFAKSSCTVINTSPGCVAITGNPSNVIVQNTGTGSAAIGFTCPIVNYIYNGVSGPCLATGINENSVNNTDVQIYPNPNNGKFTFDLTIKSDICVTNAIGQIILKETLFNGKHNVDLSTQPIGIYFIHITNKSSSQTFKIIKE